MSLLDKFKDTVSNIGNETLGNIDAVKVKEKDETPKKEKKKQETKIKKEKKSFLGNKNNIKQEETFNKIDDNEDDEIFVKPEKKSFSSVVNKSTTIIKGHSPMLEILGISENVSDDSVLEIDDFENVEFTKVAPVGIDIPEVERFVDKTIRELKKLHNIIEKRQDDFEKLYHEALRLESKVIAYQHDSQLANSILGNKEKEDSLKEEIIKLRLENQELKHKLDVKGSGFSYENKNDNSRQRKISLPDL